MKTLQIKKLSVKPVTAEEVPQLLDHADIMWQPMEHANWHDRFPYTPEVAFRIAHTGDSILLHYQVREEAVRAIATADVGKVWEDSCCEFFIHDADTSLYNNVECNCATTLYMAVGKERNNRSLLDSEDMMKVLRWSSLEKAHGNPLTTPVEWTLAVIVPVNILFDRRLRDISGMAFRANLYKCGDCLPHPHFLSWNPVDIPQPDFHRPDHFGQLVFSEKP